MSQLIIHAGDFIFQARFEETVGAKDLRGISQGDAFREPGHPCALERRGCLDARLAISISASLTRTTPAIPAPGQIILYPGGISETEILLAYGGVHFACQDGGSSRAITSSR